MDKLINNLKDPKIKTGVLVMAAISMVCITIAVVSLVFHPNNLAPSKDPAWATETTESIEETEEVVEPTQEPTEPPHVHEYVETIYEPTCEERGLTERLCACGELLLSKPIEALGHSYTSHIVEPTTTEGGYTEDICIYCGISYKYDETEKLPYYKEVDEIVYATEDMNIRTGPGTEYDRIGILDCGSYITRIGIGDNGWSKVQFEGEIGYIKSEYLIPESEYKDGSQPSEEIKDKMRANEDLVGVLYIPSIGMEPLNLYRPYEGADLQILADKKNVGYSVGVYATHDKEITKIEIGDHSNQNFSRNEDIHPGSEAYINMGGKVLRMTCVLTIESIALEDYDARIYNDNESIITLTCAETGRRTMNKWVVTDDSDVSYDEFYEITTKWLEGTRY